MRPIVGILIVAFLAMATVGLAASDELIPFTAVLTGGQEIPPNQSNAFGVAFMTFDERTSMLNFSITYTDERLLAAEVSAHFHAPAIPGVAAPVVFGLVNPGSFNLGSPKVGSVGPFSEDQRRDLEEGLFYINIHSTVLPAGEIRGQVLPVGNGLDYIVEAEVEAEAQP